MSGDGEPPPNVKEGKRPGAILFMCGMNAIRSPMAEAIARSITAGQSVYIASAGVRRRRARPLRRCGAR